MNYRDYVYRKINENGFIFCHSFDERVNAEILKMYKEGLLVRLSELGIEFSNGEYYYTYLGNPYQLVIRNRGGGLYEIAKGTKVEH